MPQPWDVLLCVTRFARYVGRNRLLWPCLGRALVGLCLHRCDRVDWERDPPRLVVAEVVTAAELRRILALVRASRVATLLLVPAGLVGPELPDAGDRRSLVRVVAWSDGEDRRRVAVRAGQALVGLVVTVVLRERYDFWVGRLTRIQQAINGHTGPAELSAIARCTPLASWLWMHTCALAGGLLFPAFSGLDIDLAVHRNTVRRQRLELPTALELAFHAPGAGEAAPVTTGNVEGLQRSAAEAADVVGGLIGLQKMLDDARVGMAGLARDVLALAVMREARDGTESLAAAAALLDVDESCFGRL